MCVNWNWISFKIFFPLLVVLFLCVTPAFCSEADVEEREPLLGVREGWSWPVVVIQPPEGWDSPEGNTIKLAMRTAERELSLERDAINGREVTFMFSDVADARELGTRLAMWRAMQVAAIVTFADDEFSDALAELCAENGPSLIYAGGVETSINSPETGEPYPYLFALELPYFARANALAEAASLERPGELAAVFTDILSTRLARGAALTSDYLEARNMTALDLSTVAYRQDQFTPQVRELEAGGTKIYICWLDAMATLSIWQTLERRHVDSVVYYSGPQRDILTDADGIILVDETVLLERNTEGHDAISKLIRDRFGDAPIEPVLAARAYALARWVIAAYREVGTGDDVPAMASALAGVSGIPLMDETLSIDPATHRPKSRKYGLLRVESKRWESYGSVDVFSAETVEQ